MFFALHGKGDDSSSLEQRRALSLMLTALAAFVKYHRRVAEESNVLGCLECG